MNLEPISKFQAAVAQFIVLSKTVCPELNTPEYIEKCTEHFFNSGTYVRKCSVPAGTVLVGKIHRYSNTTVVAKGRAIVVSTHSDAREICAGDVYNTEPLNQNVFLVLEDLVITTTHSVTSTNLDQIEQELIIPDNETLTRALLSKLTAVVGG